MFAHALPQRVAAALPKSTLYVPSDLSVVYLVRSIACAVQSRGPLGRERTHVTSRYVPYCSRLRTRAIGFLSTLPDEHVMLRDMCVQYAAKNLTPLAGALDKEHRFPTKQVEALGQMGLMGVAIDDAYGGAGLDYLAYAIAIEEISRGCASTGVIMSVNNVRPLGCGRALAGSRVTTATFCVWWWPLFAHVFCFGLCSRSTVHRLTRLARPSKRRNT